MVRGMLVCLVAFYCHSTDKDTKKLPFHEILAMFLLLAGGKSFASKERQERRVFIPLPVSRLRLMVANFVTTRVYATKSRIVLLSRKIVLPLPLNSVATAVV